MNYMMIPPKDLLRHALKQMAASERQAEIDAAMKEITEQERRERLLGQARQLEIDELERRLA